MHVLLYANPYDKADVRTCTLYGFGTAEELKARAEGRELADLHDDHHRGDTFLPETVDCDDGRDPAEVYAQDVEDAKKSFRWQQGDNPNVRWMRSALDKHFWFLVDASDAEQMARDGVAVWEPS